MADYPFLQNSLLFTRLLRRAGIPVALEQAADFTEALSLVDIGSRDQVYHAARGLLLNRHENVRLFDTIFNRFWRVHANRQGTAQPMPVAPRHNVKRERRYDIVQLMAQKAQAGDREIDVADKAGTFSAAEVLQRKAFSDMTAEELAAVKRLMQSLRWRMSERVTRRRTADPQGNLLDLRQVLRAAAKQGGVPLTLAWRTRKIKQRPLILIADISGSMEKYSRLMLQFGYGLSHSLGDVEAFVFGTRLTRITGQLKLKNIDRAVDEAAREVVDWSGGTRIGASLHTFNQVWSRRVLRRGAVVILISDGWERGNTAELATEMRRLRHRCHRLIWLNPLLGQRGYQPLVEGMAAALPYIDDFLPVHNLQSLEALAQHLAALGRHSNK